MWPGSDKSFPEIVKRWEPIALQAPVGKPDAPIAIITGEATYLAALLAQRWEPRGEDRPLPGMKQALITGLFDENILLDVRELTAMVAYAESQVKAVPSEGSVAPVRRAKELLLEIRQALGFLFDDGVLDGRDGALERMNQSHNDTQRQHALAASLEGFAIFAGKYQAQLLKLPGFDPNTLDEAFSVVQALREHSARRLTHSPKLERQRRVAFRNRLVGLLHERVAKLRRAARYVFRHHPKLAREFASEYQRQKRARSRARSIS